MRKIPIDMVKNGITYRNPPLIEALFDIRVKLDPNFDARELEKFYEAIKERFSVRQQQLRWETAFKLDKDKPAEINSRHSENGLLLRSEDGEKVVQARMDGFTFNKLKPYNGWEKFTEEALDLWSLYKSIAKPMQVTRLALRFINLLELPLPFGDLKEYVLTSPDIAPETPNAMSEFLLRVVIPEPGTGNVAIITETIDLPKITPEKLPLIFDLDVYKDVEFDSDDEKIWETFLSLRDYKNLIFSKTLTEKAKDLYR